MSSNVLQAEWERERERQQEAEEVVRRAGPRAIGHNAPPRSALLPARHAPLVPGNILDPESTAAALAAVSAAAAAPQRRNFGRNSAAAFAARDAVAVSGERGVIRRAVAPDLMRLNGSGGGDGDAAAPAPVGGAGSAPAADGGGPGAGAAAVEGEANGEKPLAARLPGADWRERCGPMGIPADERRSSPIVELSLLLVNVVSGLTLFGSST